MQKNVEIHVYRNGRKLKIKNNMGGEWEFKATQPSCVIASLIGMTMANQFDQEQACSDEFEMTLIVESLDKK